jgi:hypothetical protein
MVSTLIQYRESKEVPLNFVPYDAPVGQGLRRDYTISDANLSFLGFVGAQHASLITALDELSS